MFQIVTMIMTITGIKVTNTPSTKMVNYETKKQEKKMNKLNKKLVALGLLAVAGLSGCATNMNNLSTEQFNSKKEGVIYGELYGGYGVTKRLNPISNITELCKSINNQDSRCNEPEMYYTAPIQTKWGYADGVVGVVAVADKRVIDIEHTKTCMDGRSSACTFYKVKVEQGKLPTVVEVASKQGEGKCKWASWSAISGVTCPAYNWDYHKDNQASIVLQ
jgi:hypothetical protein